MAKRLLRSEVPVEMTWDLTDLFKTREEWQKGLKDLEGDIGNITAFKGRSCESGKTLLECVLQIEKAYIKIIQLGTYASLKQAGDGTDPVNQEDSMVFDAINTKVQAAASFLDSEIVALSDKQFNNLLQEEGLEVFKIYLKDIHDKKQYMLTPETEQVLASLGELTESPYRIYSISKAADMKFDSFVNEKGEELPNSFALFESKYEQSESKVVRENAYASFVKTLKQYVNTYAAVYSTEVKKQVAEAKLRGHKSTEEMLLVDQKVSLEMYENQLNIIYKELAPHMQRYAKLKQKLLGLDKICFHDLKAPINAGVDMPATFESVKQTILEGLEVMGEEYQSMLKTAFDSRWIDYSDNVGKSTGAFCSSPYGVHPYVLATFTNNMRSAFLLAHELGHAGHFYYANNEQRVFNTRPSMYFVEAPSTMNELLVGQHLIKKYDTPEMKRWVILQLLGTYYHNFVTHLLEGEFQRRVYRAAEKGVSLTAKMLCETKLAVIKGFWGDSVDIDDAAGMTWMRQPHYYMGLYPYSYSAGLTASTAIAQQISEEGQPAVDRWTKVLKAGGTLTPHGLLKLAGLDMTTPEPIRKAVNYVGGLITELEELF
ncbi:oligoendopeptidase F [Clostridium sp. 'deep sea']|uniref:oligoendopeptidase F n=1 Tax=Clostridium sp. 'deep sea' TaxID=2779445 RepID=UPI0018968BC5|nr:oligoendopeptidase F [Clostridium sp. 'deep sea']QOR35387.1 oligoendopeptidase F [Clostridium sp. 'deep sea']